MKDNDAIVNPKMEELLEHTENKFTLVIEAAKRARQIKNFHKRLGEGVGGVAPLKLEDISRKPLSVALGEIAEGKIEYDRSEMEEAEE